MITVSDVLDIHRKVIEATGGLPGIRDIDLLDSALVQPDMSFGGQDLYVSDFDKAAALTYSLVMNHPFLDGNKRVGFVTMALYLREKGYVVTASQDEIVSFFLSLASGDIGREELSDWIACNLQTLS
jgi:death-on-curing protein